MQTNIKAVFITSDGYRLTLKKGVWTDGDMTFENRSPWPVDDRGRPLEGRVTIDRKYKLECGHTVTREIQSVRWDGADLHFPHSQICHDCRLARRKYRLTRVCIEDSPPIEAYVIDGEYWNGWMMPYFTKEQGMAYLTWQNRPGNPYVSRYDEVLDAFVTVFDEDAEQTDTWEAETITVDGQPLKVWGIGAGSWVWDEEVASDAS